MLTKKREHLVNENLRHENLRRRKYDYEINQKVLKKLHKPTKLGEKHEGPYNIEKSIVMAILLSNYVQMWQNV